MAYSILLALESRLRFLFDSRKGDAVASILEVVRPADVQDTLRVVGDSKRNPRVLAGGTDLLVQYQERPGPDFTIVDLSGVKGLRRIEADAEGLLIGSAVRLTDVIESEQVNERFPAVSQGAVVVASPQIRNLATIGGNVCNASPSADTIPPLLAYQSEARIISMTGRRTVPLHDFFEGPGKTCLEPGEILEAIWLPWPASGTVADYTKVSPRRAMDLAVVGVAVALWRTDAGLETRIGIGAVAPTPVRAADAEQAVSGAQMMTEDIAETAGRIAASRVSPISDVRGTARYRRTMVERIVARSLLERGAHLQNAGLSE